ncbi:MAG: Asp-tRNA(Asn)/Glu-tRNA(Gln) amidotransferase subunit GatB, partial [Bacilli bacterium]|nr:Asp-tRNA(Asn)/Glu-tRNA(Gln) amidotransferase subunit GatB [Bacilli bacterium]
MSNEYQVTAGTEVHCELKSNTKMFSDSYNNYGTFANTNINEIDLAYPGTLPTINSYAVELALKAALALNCKINKKMHFDRKNYFYPDLPKGYQITQARSPIGVDGYLEIEVDGITKKIGIHDIHIEEDTCKSTHYKDKSFLDFNRSGVPLIEIVSEPDLKSDKETVAYLEKLRETLLYLNVSDCKIEEGSMRCDVNVSVSKTEVLGTRTETKNVGSISSAGMAVVAEAKRQIEELERGGIIREETRRYDEKENKTILMRVKEVGNDYRYFPEPDIPFMVLVDSYIEKVRENLEILPNERRKVYLEK